MTQQQMETEVRAAAPFGTVYFGVVVLVVGLLVLFATQGAIIGALISLSGVMLVCTGLIQRSISRIG